MATDADFIDYVHAQAGLGAALRPRAIVAAKALAIWSALLLALLAPDLLMAGYLLGRRVGALVYNLAHLYALPQTGLLHNLRVSAERYPEKVGLWFYGRELTYGDFDDQVGRLAGHLAAQISLWAPAPA